MQRYCRLFLDYFKFLGMYTGYNPTQKNCIKKTPNNLRVFSLFKSCIYTFTVQPKVSSAILY